MYCRKAPPVPKVGQNKDEESPDQALTVELSCTLRTKYIYFFVVNSSFDLIIDQYQKDFLLHTFLMRDT